MENELIDDKLSQTILKALNLKTFPLRKGTKAFEVPGWDSLSHVTVIMAVEDEYNVRFNTRDLVTLQSVGDLEALLKRSGK